MGEIVSYYASNSYITKGEVELFDRMSNNTVFSVLMLKLYVYVIRYVFVFGKCEKVGKRNE